MGLICTAANPTVDAACFLENEPPPIRLQTEHLLTFTLHLPVTLQLRTLLKK